MPLFIDANIPIYAGGRPHPLREPCLRVLTRASERPDLFVTDAEVVQELLHHYLSVRAWERGERVVIGFARLMHDRIVPVSVADVLGAADSVARYADLSARDLIHLSVMRRLGSTRIVSADRDFDRVPDVTRLDPTEVEAWREQVEA